MDAVELGRATMGLFNWGKAVKDAGDGVNSAFTGIGSGISNIINSSKGQIPPELQGQLLLMEAEIDGKLKQAEIDVQIKVKEIMVGAQQSVYDFALQYEGRADQVPKWILVMRSLIRPIVTMVMFFSLLFFIGYDVQNIIAGEEMSILSALPQPYWVILGIVVGFWFGGKAGENIVAKLKER